MFNSEPTAQAAGPGCYPYAQGQFPQGLPQHKASEQGKQQMVAPDPRP